MTEWYFTEFTLGSTDVEVFSRIEKMVRSKGTRTCQATEELEFLINVFCACTILIDTRDLDHPS